MPGPQGGARTDCGSKAKEQRAHEKVALAERRAGAHHTLGERLAPLQGTFGNPARRPRVLDTRRDQPATVHATHGMVRTSLA